MAESPPGAQVAVKLWLWADLLVGPLGWDVVTISEKDLGPKVRCCRSRTSCGGVTWRLWEGRRKGRDPG